MDIEPLIGARPVIPPLALHDDALVADQVSIALAPDLIVVGVALTVTVGAGDDTVTVAD